MAFPPTLPSGRTTAMTNIYYVYQYVREDLTPYYIGKGKGYRAWVKHSTVQLPIDLNRIVIIAENLTESQAHSLEIELIAKYGRKNNGTGILRNLTDGGEGSSGYKHNDHAKNKMKNVKRNKPKPFTEQHKRNLSLSIKKSNRTYNHCKDYQNKLLENKLHNFQQKKNPNLTIVTCPYCNKSGAKPGMLRWHFESCKAV